MQPDIPGLFSPAPAPSVLPATEKQIAYAKRLAARSGVSLPDGLRADRTALSAWIDAHRMPPPAGRFDRYPSSKQVAFAERIARIKRRDIPRACFQDKTLMSRWIDGNRP